MPADNKTADLAAILIPFVSRQGQLLRDIVVEVLVCQVHELHPLPTCPNQYFQYLYIQPPQTIPQPD